ncbi:hypothetical protein INR49_023328, partial [Caranx melampygus]
MKHGGVDVLEIQLYRIFITKDDLNYHLTPTVTCRSNTYPKGFYCSWHQIYSTYIPTTFEVDVQHNQRSLEVQKDPVHKNRCQVRFPEVFSTFPYKVTVTAVNALGRASTVTSFEEANIVKPDPPERVTATPVNLNPRRLEVSWQSPATWPDTDNFPLKYFLRYRPLIREQWQHVELSDSTSHTITDAYAGKEYIIQVAAKDTEIGTWSDWSVAVHATPWIEDPLPITSTTEGDFITETKTSPIPSSNAPQKAEPPVGRAAKLLTFFSPLLLGMLLLLMCAPVPLSLAVETEKAQALLQTFSSASLLASAGLGMFCVVADHALQLSGIQNHLWLRAALDNATHGLVGLWSWAVVIGLRKKSDLYEVLLAGLLASIIDLDHFYMAGSLSLKVRCAPVTASSGLSPSASSSTLLLSHPVLCLSLRFLMWIGRLKDAWCSLPWMLFISMATHHVRDAVRHGLWVCPFGNTAPIPYWLYVSTTATLPHLCSVLMYLTGTRDVISTKHG